MNLEQFTGAVGGFRDLPHTDKILHFAWFLHAYERREYVSAGTIAACYDRLHMARPSAIHPFLNSLSSQKNPRLIRDGNGFRVERSSRDQFEAKYLKRQSSLVASTLLNSLSDKITSAHQKTFLAETLNCFAVGAYRASIVMAWNLAYDHVCTYILSNRLSDFNLQLNKIHSKSERSQIGSRVDFEDIKESRVLEIGRGAGIFPASMFKVLKEKLEKRNTAAHPSDMTISSIAAEDVIFDLVENVILKLK
jgi:hypothetical protein